MMGGSGLLSEAVMEHTNTKLEAAIEDLRIKYEKIRAEEAKQKAEKEAAEKAKAEAEEKKEEENDWTIHEDADLEGIRQASSLERRRRFTLAVRLRAVELAPSPSPDNSCLVTVLRCRPESPRSKGQRPAGRATARPATGTCARSRRRTF
jgi:hypothetical protein